MTVMLPPLLPRKLRLLLGNLMLNSGILSGPEQGQGQGQGQGQAWCQRPYLLVLLMMPVLLMLVLLMLVLLMLVIHVLLMLVVLKDHLVLLTPIVYPGFLRLREAPGL